MATVEKKKLLKFTPAHFITTILQCSDENGRSYVQERDRMNTVEVLYNVIEKYSLICTSQSSRLEVQEY